jgi:hypothetical protein
MSSNKRADDHKSIRELLLPESTPLPNRFFGIIRLLTLSEILVFMCVWRKTVGWQKVRDYVSLSQIQKETGIGRRQAVAGLALFTQAGFFHRTCRGARGMALVEIRVENMGQAFENLQQLVSKRNQCRRETRTGSDSTPELVSQRKLTGVKGKHTESNSIENDSIQSKKKKAADAAAPPASDFGIPKTEPAKPSAYDSTLGALKQAYRAKFSRGFAVPKKTEEELRGLVIEKGRDAVLTAYRTFLATDDEWLGERSYPLAAFTTQFENYVPATRAQARSPQEPLVEFEGRMIPIWLRDEKVKEGEEMKTKRERREQAEAEDKRLAALAESTPL